MGRKIQRFLSDHSKKVTHIKTKQTFHRVIIYLAGMVILAWGLTLNTQAGLGSSAIISIPYSIGQGLDLNFADLTLAFYCFLVLLQFIIKGRNRKWIDLLQIPLSIVFTRFMALFQYMLDYHSGSFARDLITLLLGILFTGIGAAITVDMQLIPNPGDGIVSCISEHFGKELGLCKNCVDIFCVGCSLVIGLIFGDPLLGIGLGTVISMIGVGRVIYLFNRLAKPKLVQLAGI